MVRWLLGSLLASILSSGAEAYTLRVRVQPGRGFGGEAFREQPQVEVLEGDGGDIDVFFQGYATAEMVSSPDGLSSLLYDNSSGGDGSASLTRGRGRATFSGLYVNKAGKGFVCRFVAFNTNGVGVAWVDSDPFDVNVGDPYAIALSTAVGAMHGGSTFDIPPVVAVQDKGGNVVESYSGGRINAWLVDTPGSGALMPSERVSETIRLGYATFDSLRINEAGVGYRLGFETSGLGFELHGASYVESEQFTVGVGPASSLHLETDIFQRPLVSGSPFPDQPRIRAYDLGGNMLSMDSESGVLVSIVVNPAAATLQPEDRVFEVMTEGVATFSGISLNRSGYNLRLRFSLYAFDRFRGKWNDTGVYLDTPFFDVEDGYPAALHIRQDVDGSWAGGRGFKKQPYLTVMDAGGDMVSSDSVTKVSVTVTPSLMVNHDVVVNTSADPQVGIEKVFTTIEDGVYGVGQDVPITVVFTAPVYVSAAIDEDGPYLHLNGSRAGDPSSLLAVMPNTSYDLSPSCEQTFVYTVLSDDVLATGVLEIAGRSAIEGGASFRDLLDRETNVTLPGVSDDSILSAKTSISIDTAEPVVTAACSSLEGGEYGVGQIIPVWVNFTFPVVVVVPKGASLPFLPLTASSLNGNLSSTFLAEYTAGNGTSSLLFHYTVDEGDAEEGLTWIIGVPDDDNASILLPSTKYRAFDASPRILQRSTVPSVAANLSLEGISRGGPVELCAGGGNVTLETTPPEVDASKGLKVAGAGNGTYFAGDEVFLRVWFTKPVVVLGDVGLFLASGTRGARANFVSGGNGTHDITFRYDVVEGDSTSLLEVEGRDALDMGDMGFIRRHASSPVQDAKLDLGAVVSAGMGLADTSRVTLDGARPHPISVQVAPDTNDYAAYGLGSVIRIAVTFDKNVTVMGSPVLVLDCRRMREALYIGGNGSTSLIFEYEVQVGDYTNNLGYRFYPNALCLEVPPPWPIIVRLLTPQSGCQDTPSIVRKTSISSIRQLTTMGGVPGIDASLSLPNSRGSRAEGVPVASNVTVDTRGARATYVVGLSTDTPAGSYGAGQVIDILVHFSDELLLETSGLRGALPTLSLNNGGEAVLVEGTGTKTWLFSYEYPGGSETTESWLDVANESEHSAKTTLNCTVGCRAANWNGERANLSLVGFNLSYAKIELDDTAPTVLSLYSLKETSPWDDVYTAGEEIEVRVVFDRPVSVLGSPRLNLDTTGYAAFDRIVGKGMEVCFRYVVAEGHVSGNLTWAGPLALHANGVDGGGNEDWILRKSTYPHTLANVTLPNPSRPVAINGSTIHVNATGRPQVVNVTSPNRRGTYAPGDVITVLIDFDRYVMVIGEPFLHLNTGGKHPGVAVYVDGSETKRLVFEYAVTEGDLTERLALSDRHALVFGFDAAMGTRGYESKLRSLVAQASTNPIVAANRVMPFYPGEAGSLSSSTTIALDGSVPHIERLTFGGTGNMTYAGGDVLQVVVQFSAPVVVSGSGSPALKLETGLIDREAVWINASSTASSAYVDDALVEEVRADASLLLFEYTVVTGDKAHDLDYWCDEEKWRDARASFVLPDNGTTVKRLSAHPSLDADLHLNPPGGYLSGTDRATAFGGWVYFRDLFLRTRGRGYKMNFEAFVTMGGGGTAAPSSPTINGLRGGIVLKQSTVFEVGFAVEFEVMSNDADESDLFGHAISLDDGSLLVGAPGKHLEVPEIQLVVSTGSSAEVIPEVQMVAVGAVHVKEIQRFSTFAEPHETVGGFWSLVYPGLGSSRGIPSDATIEQVQVALEEDFPTLGRMLVSREEYTFCVCEKGYTWTITFDELEGDIYPFVPDSSQMTGAGANVTAIEVLQNSPVLGGTFTLSHTGWSINDTEGTGNETAWTRTTRPIPFDANDSFMSAVILEDLQLWSDIETDCCDPQLGRKWSITFGSDRGDWNVSTLSCNSWGLTGNNASCWQLTGRDGRGPPSGSFRLRFRESAWTSWLPHDVEADELRMALLALESVGSCAVSRSEAGSAGKHVWAVTFLQVRKYTTFGYVVEEMGNLPAMEVDSRLIRGTDAAMEVRYAFGGAMDYAPWEGKQRGAHGDGAGAAYVFSRSPAAEGYVWKQDQKLLGSDTDGVDAFGLSVFIDETYELLAIGAPYAEDNGVPEVQALSCKATSGTFTLSFRGFTSATISANASLFDLYTALRGPFGSTNNIHSFPEIDVTERFPSQWEASSPAGLCTGNNSAFLSFRTPKHDFWGGAGDLELLTVDASLLDGVVTVEEIVRGTTNPDGPYSRGVQKGAAYIFRRSKSTGRWYEQTKLSLDDGEGTDRYGWQVVVQGRGVTNDYVIVSAPGRSGERGAVYVYTFSDSEQTWSMLQSITSELWSLDTDEFGGSLCLNGDTLAVGGAGYNSSAGAAYVFTVSRSGVFQADQMITHPDQPRPGDRCGESISLDSDFLVLGCPGREDTWLHTGQERTHWEGEDVGAVYLFRRDSAETAFYFFQKLEASNVKPFDRFGASVSLERNSLIVGSHQHFEEGILAYQRAVQVVTVQSDPGGKGVDNVYRLGWKEECSENPEDELGPCKVRWTRDIAADATGIEMKNTLEEAFGLGVGVSELVVARSGRDESTGGYQYTIVFMEETGDVPMMLVDDSEITGPNAYVSVESLNEVPEKLRGVAHVFARQVSDDVDSPFREQCFLYPWIKQRQDLFGTSVAVSGHFVAVSAPNRDTVHGSFEDQNLTSLNTGAVEVFTLDFLSFRFDRANFSLLEGDTFRMNITRFSQLSTTQAFNIKSIDRNADQEFQEYIAAVYDLSVAYPDVPVFQTAADVVGAGTATARSQYYGSLNNRSLWLGGMFDYRGLSDYIPIEDQVQFLAGRDSVEYLLNTTDDNVLEMPDETLTIALYIPGMFPSYLGDLIAGVVIQDNGDGEGDGSRVSRVMQGSSSPSDTFTTFLDRKSYVSKLSVDSQMHMDRFGGAVDSAEGAGLVIIGDEFSEIDGLDNCGSAYIFTLSLGAWEQMAQLLPGRLEQGAHFGQAVQIDKAYGREHYTATVGAPGQATVYVFEYNQDLMEWTQVTELKAPGVMLPSAGIGGTNSLSLSGDLVAVGAPRAESVYLYRRNLTVNEDGTANGTWGDEPSKIFMSSDFDYDIVHLKTLVHRQDYGASVALDVSSRTLAVGSPFADYDKLGTDEVEAYDSRPEKAETRSRGKVYTYYSKPSVQSVTLGTEFRLTAGTFMLTLEHRNVTSNSTQISWDAGVEDMKLALESASNVEEVEVTKDSWTDSTGFDYFRWMVSFVSEYAQDPGVLKPSWRGNGCEECVAFSSRFPRGGEAYVNTSREAWMGEWEEEAVLQASDRRSGDRFGSSLALDQETLVIGADHSSALAETTWDFETGDLVGWRRTGDAFDLQPTFGDNPFFRSGSLESSGEGGAGRRASKTRFRGRYFVGTFEARPGAGWDDYTNPNQDYPPGSSQGDGPVGTLTSEVFTIGGDGGNEFATITVLVGGGCDDRKEYVELLADGVGVAKATGTCSEAMFAVRWDVSSLVGRAGQIRIVDASDKSPWGHINVDEIDLSWENRGGIHPESEEAPVHPRSISPQLDSTRPRHILVLRRDRIAMPTKRYREASERSANFTLFGPSSKAHYVAQEGSTSRAGAAYVFSRVEEQDLSTEVPREFKDSDVPSSTFESAATCPEETSKLRYCASGRVRNADCKWQESAKLTARDRRGGDLFGASLSVDHETGVAVVGAAGASLTGIWQEAPTVYTTTNPHGDAESARATRIPLPMDARNGDLLRLQGAYGSLKQSGSGAPAVWELQDTVYALEISEQRFNQRGNAKAGAVYVFTRLDEVEGAGLKCALEEEEMRGDAAGTWEGTERFKLQAHDAYAADSFGSAVSYLANKRDLFVGAPRSDSYGEDFGATYQFDMGIMTVGFTQTEFTIEEGKWRGLHEGPQYLEGWLAVIKVARDKKHADELVTVAFATSDLTARGIDSDAYEECSGLAVRDRLPGICGDYEQTAGELTLEPGQIDEAFFVRIMDDHCRERYPEYVQLSLSIPGGAALQGERYMSKLRIEDNDQDREDCL